MLNFSKYFVRKNKLHQLMISWSNIHLDLNFNITSLTLYQGDCGVTGAILVSSFLYHNACIQELDISNNKLIDKGAIAIGKSLKSNFTLQKLNISHNKIHNKGIISISEALKKI